MPTSLWFVVNSHRLSQVSAMKSGASSLPGSPSRLADHCKVSIHEGMADSAELKAPDGVYVDTRGGPVADHLDVPGSNLKVGDDEPELICLAGDRVFLFGQHVNAEGVE